jgi:uncharacterized protein (TIGR03790 family)
MKYYIAINERVKARSNNDRRKKPEFIFVCLVCVVFVFMSISSRVYAVSPQPSQSEFRFRKDDGSESTATWMAGQNTNITNIAKNTTFRIRITTQMGLTSMSGLKTRLEYLLASGNTCTSAGWTSITTAASNAFTLASSANFTDGTSTTQQLTGGTGNFTAGEILQATNPADSMTIPSNGYTEDEYSIQATANASDNTAYIFRLSNNSAAYTGGYSVCPQATTATLVPPTLTTSDATLVSSSTLTLNANISTTGGVSITDSGFAYGTTNDLSTGAATTSLGAQGGTGNFSGGITGLSPNTLYYFRAYAVNSVGTSTGAILSTTTLQWAAPSQPTSISAATSSPNQATISFTAPASSGGSSILYYLASSTPGNFTATSTVSPIVVLGLTNNTSYTFAVYAVNLVGTSSPSSASNAVTPTATLIPPTLTTSDATLVSTSTMTLNGSITSGGNSSSTIRGFAWGTNSNLSGGDTATTTETGTFGIGSFTKSITSLTASTLYYFRAYAVNLAGTSMGSIIATSTVSFPVSKYSDTLLVINDNSTISTEVGNYFLAARPTFPTSNVVHISTVTSESVSSSEYANHIKSTIETFISTNGLSNTINYVILTKGIPIYDSGTSNSVDSELAWCLGKQICSGTSNPFYNSNTIFSHQAYNMYIVTRLDGYVPTNDGCIVDNSTCFSNGNDISQITKLIDNSSISNILPLATLKSQGLFVLDGGGSYDSLANHMLESANQLLMAKGWKTNLDETSTYLTHQQNVLGYWSWGSNADSSPTMPAYAIPGNTYENGAIGETAVSTSARSFGYPPSYGQSLIADWIAEGISGMKGYVSEPSFYAIAHPDILFDHYTSGYNMAESYYAASSDINWKDLVVGDPKMAIVFTVYTIGGNISGLTGILVLQNNSGDNLSISANGSFTFATSISDGNPYSVTVLTQPSGQTCSVSSGSGTVPSDVTSVSVTCTNNPVTPTPTVTTTTSFSNGGGSVSASALAQILAPSASTTAYLNSLNNHVAGCPKGFNCTPIPGFAMAANPQSPNSVPNYRFTRNIQIGMTGNDVKELQIFLNSQGFTVAKNGAGSPGHETAYFGPATKTALMKFQLTYKKDILTPQGLTAPTGFFGAATMKAVNKLMK